MTRDTVYLLESNRFNGDFNVVTQLGAFRAKSEAEKCAQELKTLKSNFFTKFSITPIKFYENIS